MSLVEAINNVLSVGAESDPFYGRLLPMYLYNSVLAALRAAEQYAAEEPLSVQTSAAGDEEWVCTACYEGIPYKGCLPTRFSHYPTCMWLTLRDALKGDQ